MRLWHLEGRRLVRILRGPQVPLRYRHGRTFARLLHLTNLPNISSHCWISFLPGNWSWPVALIFVCSSWLKRRISGNVSGSSFLLFLFFYQCGRNMMFCCARLPSLKDVLLYVKMGVPGESRYYPAEELVWDVSRESSPRSLRTCLAAHYGLSPDCLLLAKHLPDKHTWEEISSWVMISNFSARCYGRRMLNFNCLRHPFILLIN